MSLRIVCLSLLLLSAASGHFIEPERPPITGVAHMALLVSDLERARAFYRDFLGFQEPYELKNKDGTSSVVFFKVNEDQYIELFPGLKSDQDRLHHISFATADAAALRDYLASRRVAVPNAINTVRIGNTAFTVKDPEGHTVEFTQYELSGWTRREKGKYLSESRISTRILHVGIIVGDARLTSRFYADVLRLKEFWRGSSRDSQYVSWINMRLPESDDYIEYMLYSTLPPPTQRGSQHHICLEVPDVEKAMLKLEANPYRKSYTRPMEVRVGINRRRQLNLYDPDGTRIELMEARTVDGQPAPPTTLPLPRG